MSLSTERLMVRMMSSVRLRDNKSSNELKMTAGLHEDSVAVVKMSRLRWYGMDL